MTKGKAQRSFAGNSYWKPFAERPNLHTVTHAVVRNIVFSSDRSGDLVATGLNFTAGNQSYIANATKEVIISGGTMKSPQMLELSGIGNGDLLRSLDIEVLIDNPNVGENFQDHPQCGLPFVLDHQELTFDDIYDDERKAYWTKIYETNHTGLLTTGISQTAQLSWNQILGPDQQNRPAEMVAKYYNGTASRPGLKAQLDLTAQKLLDPNQSAIQTGGSSGNGGKPKKGEENTSAFIGGFVTHAFSRGYIHIQSTDPNVDPKFDPRYLSHPLDFEVLKDLVLFSLNISSTPPLSSHLKDNGTVLVPPLTEMNDTTVRELFNTALITGWHVVGSNAMLPRDQGGVLNPRLKVYGTQNVRVVDASIVPLHVRGNTVSLTYAIAEKAADIIKQDINGTATVTGGGSQPFVGSGTAIGLDKLLMVVVVCACLFLNL
ncbi:MAG: hypothetical protein L6R41_005061 [Letrouitia leprolyta]|nr:MAG: hypothetical protein L6R41_005061 [Letrouitia leprolyta]